MQRVSSLNGSGPATHAAAFGIKDRRSSSLTLPPRLALLEDERLVWLVARGSQRAFATVYERYQPQLYAYCYLLLHNDDDAYDTLQATFTRALAALRQGERNGSLRPLLFRIAREEAISLDRDRAAAAEDRRTAARLRWTEDGAEERARLALLMADLRDLPELQRSALLMRELAGLSHHEIATALGISTQGAKQATFRARRSLAEVQRGRSLACEEVRRMISHLDGRMFRRRSVRAHLRDCRGCTAFAAGITTRRADLQALAPPLAPALASRLMAHLSRMGSGHRAGLTAGWAGKTFGPSLAAKALLAVAIAVTAASAVTGAITLTKHDRRGPAVAPPAHRGQAGGRAHRRERWPSRASSSMRANRRNHFNRGSDVQAHGRLSPGSAEARSADGDVLAAFTDANVTAAAPRQPLLSLGPVAKSTRRSGATDGRVHPHGASRPATRQSRAAGAASGAPHSDRPPRESGVQAHAGAKGTDVASPPRGGSEGEGRGATTHIPELIQPVLSAQAPATPGAGQPQSAQGIASSAQNASAPAAGPNLGSSSLALPLTGSS